MSMISTQIDELRKWADLYDGTAKPALSAELQRPYLAHGLRDAADTIQQLRDDLQRANAENAKLRDENARLRSCLSDDADNARQIMAENAKLRELVRDMFACISHANEADWFYFERDKLGCGMRCVVNGEGCGLPVLADRMRELGVEVEG